MLMFRCRAEFILSKILAENKADSTVAAVTHGGMLNQLYRALLRLPLGTDLRFSTDDAGVHEWLILGDSRCVVKASMFAFAAQIYILPCAAFHFLRPCKSARIWVYYRRKKPRLPEPPVKRRAQNGPTGGNRL